jgi:uncharacterized protein (TIGR03067 family)
MGPALILISSMALALGSDNTPGDLALMQGTWNVAAAERDGEKAPAEEIKTLQVVIDGNTITIVPGKNAPGPRQEKGTLTLKPSAKPKAFDIAPADGKGAKTAHGIYELDGSTLRMCWTKDGGERPREFATKPNSNRAMFVFKREKGE